MVKISPVKTFDYQAFSSLADNKKRKNPSINSEFLTGLIFDEFSKSPDTPQNFSENIEHLGQVGEEFLKQKEKDFNTLLPPEERESLKDSFRRNSNNIKDSIDIIGNSFEKGLVLLSNGEKATQQKKEVGTALKEVIGSICDTVVSINCAVQRTSDKELGGLFFPGKKAVKEFKPFAKAVKEAFDIKNLLNLSSEQFEKLITVKIVDLLGKKANPELSSAEDTSKPASILDTNSRQIKKLEALII